MQVWEVSKHVAGCSPRISPPTVQGPRRPDRQQAFHTRKRRPPADIQCEEETSPPVQRSRGACLQALALHRHHVPMRCNSTASCNARAGQADQMSNGKKRRKYGAKPRALAVHPHARSVCTRPCSDHQATQKRVRPVSVRDATCAASRSRHSHTGRRAPDRRASARQAAQPRSGSCPAGRQWNCSWPCDPD